MAEGGAGGAGTPGGGEAGAAGTCRCGLSVIASSPWVMRKLFGRTNILVSENTRQAKKEISGDERDKRRDRRRLYRTGGWRQRRIAPCVRTAPTSRL